MGATVRIGGSRLTQGENTTTEFLSRAIHSALTERLPSFVGTLKVCLAAGRAWCSLVLRALCRMLVARCDRRYIVTLRILTCPAGFGAGELTSCYNVVQVTLHESHKAWASYSADVPASSDA